MSKVDKQYLETIKDELNKEIHGLIDVHHKASGGKIDIGRVESFADGIGVISGLEQARIGQKVVFPTSTARAGGEQIFGQIIDIDEHSTSCIVFGEERHVKVGDIVELDTRKDEHGNHMEVLSVYASEIQLGHAIDPFGRPIDLIETEEEQNEEHEDLSGYWDRLRGKKYYESAYIPIEREAPPLISRSPINTPLQTGIKAIDTMMPVGLGQRMLIIGDRGTGKSAIAIACMIHQAKVNQKRENKDRVVFVYVAIGKKISEIVSIQKTLEKYDALKDSIIVATKANDPAALLYIAPFSGCSIGEFFRDRGKHAVIIYDDLTKHANAYRHISLLLKRSPGREAFPGDVFYLHSRLLERASSVYYEQGEDGILYYSKPPAHGSKEERIIGTLTAFPIIETKENDFSAYIPTNVISITDGQIYLDNNLFNEEILPAVHTGLSVSRVGGAAQTALMKKLSKNLKADLAVFKEKKKYESFGFDLSPEDKNILTHGKRVYSFLKQPLNSTAEEKHQLVDLIKNEVLKLIESEFLGFKVSQKNNEPADVFGFKEIESLNNSQVLDAAFERYCVMYGLVPKDAGDQKAIESLKKSFQISGFADFNELKGLIVTNGDMLNTVTDILHANNKTD